MDVADMSGKTVVVTGGNSGIGLETAVALAGAGATVMITARDRGRGEAAVADIRRRAGIDAAATDHAAGERAATDRAATDDGAGKADRVGVVVFDLASLASVRQGAAELLDRCPRVDVLVNNAGLILTDRQVTVDGYEATFATNHLGPFLLTNLLLDRMKASAPSRIVNVASTAHQSARKGLDFDDLQSTRRYRAMQAYGASKLANILFTTELARRLGGTGVTANCLHPGTVATGYARDGDTRGLLAFGVKVITPFVLTAEKGAVTSVYLASAPDVADVTGEYFVKCRPRQPSKAAQDQLAARRLWDVSEQLAGMSATTAGD